MAADNVPARLLDQARRVPDLVAYREKDLLGTWRATTWSEYALQARLVARALLALDVYHQEAVCLLGFNRPEWVLFDVGATMIGGVPAGIYTTCSPQEVHHILQHAEAGVVLLEDEGQWRKVEAHLRDLPLLRHVVMMRGVTIDHPMVMAWEDFLARGHDIDDAQVDARLAAVRPEDLASLIYTSGTTGPPKGVMLTHRNLTFTSDVAMEVTGIQTGDRMVSYLPLSHIAEQMFSIHAAISAGMEIWFAESIDAAVTNMQEARPHILFGVPRVWEKIYARVKPRLEDAPPVKRRLIEWAMGVSRQTIAHRNRGEEPPALLALQFRLANRLVFRRIKGLLGMDEARFGITGAAPISAEILQFFAGLGIVILEVYGQSEDCGPATFNRPGMTKYGTVGVPIPGVDVRIAEDGEILVRGPSVFKGYYKDPAATSAALVDGWLHSGDLGSFDADGFLSITGRKKDILITAGGKNIAPKNIEAALKNLPLVSQAVVIGDRRKFLSALITLDAEAAAAFAAERGLLEQGLHDHPAVRAEVERGVQDQVNVQFARVEHIRKFTILARDLSVEDGELTPTLKVKRRVVNEHFAAEIDAMYAD